MMYPKLLSGCRSVPSLTGGRADSAEHPNHQDDQDPCVLGPPCIGGGCRPPEKRSFSSHLIQGQVSQLFEEIDHQPDDQFEINWCRVDFLFLVYFSSSIGVGERFSGFGPCSGFGSRSGATSGSGSTSVSIAGARSSFSPSFSLPFLSFSSPWRRPRRDFIHRTDLWTFEGGLSLSESGSLGRRCSPCMWLSCRRWSGQYE